MSKLLKAVKSVLADTQVAAAIVVIAKKVNFKKRG